MSARAAKAHSGFPANRKGEASAGARRSNRASWAGALAVVMLAAATRCRGSADGAARKTVYSPEAMTESDPPGTYFRKSPGALRPSRRQVLQALAAGAAFTAPAPLRAQSASEPFDQWITAFRARAAARGIPDTTYWQVMRGLKPDTTVFKGAARSA